MPADGSRLTDSPAGGSPVGGSPVGGSPAGGSPAGGSVPVLPAPDGGGRHRGPWGFGRVAGWTVLGTLLPGAGLLAAGRRRVGGVLLALVLLAGGVAAYGVLSGRALTLGRRWAFQPRAVLVVAVVVAVVAVLWCAVVVSSHLALRRRGRVAGRRALSALLVGVLVAAVGVPSATAVRYALTSRSLLLDVFGTGTSARAAGLAAPGHGSDPWAGTPRVNVLLVGADSSQGHEGTRPDTVIVASTDTRTGDTVLFGLPRQLEHIPFPAGSEAARAWPAACRANGQGGCLLNAAYLFGVQRPDLFPGAADPGLEATREAASGVTGLQLDYEVMVNLDGFQHLVDAMGGITLSIDKPYLIGGGHRLDSRGREVGSYPTQGYLPVGKDLHLDGYQAEWYVRSRANSDNNDRMDRQRCFLNAAAQQYSVAHLARAFPALASAAKEDLVTDIPASQLDAFVTLGQRVKGASLRTLSFDNPLVDTGNPDYAQIRRLVQQALDPPPAPPSGAPTPAPSAAGAPSPGASAAPPSGQALDANAVCS